MSLSATALPLQAQDLGRVAHFRTVSAGYTWPLPGGPVAARVLRYLHFIDEQGDPTVTVLGELRISGRLHHSELLDWIEGLGAVFGLEVNQLDPGTVLIRRRL